MQPSSPTRILSVSAANASWRPPAALFEALGDRHSLVGSLQPALAPAVDALIKLRHFHPRRAAWRARAGFNDATFNGLTGAVERQLRRREGSFDLIFQFQTLFAPGYLEARRPFVIYTDNIMSLTERFYPVWAPLRPAEFRRRRELEASVCRAAAYVLAWSDFLRDAVIADYGLEPSRVVRAGAAANMVLSSLDSRRWDSATAIFVGRDFTRKGGRFLLDAWPRVRARVPHARLIVVGPPHPPSGVDLGGVDWRGRVASRAELERLLTAASVFVMPSLFEPWGHVFLEAMGCGLPCIASTRCAMPEIVTDGQTGLLVPPEEAEPIADALVRLLDDPPLAEACGRRAHAAVISQHRWSDVAARISPALSSAVSSAG
jgi:glycosyltransferase involved in cell wall biosynthesis